MNKQCEYFIPLVFQAPIDKKISYIQEWKE